ncbi:hypothetical protein [Actinacidiphila epipremni]|uniref:DUF2262 domain-containing protein n=1 Tax=Actinacidiphila epipremni TaxID=2053013 RepID=A0ABX0ZZ72_9ACTN|nr:hypothetical protein [Actinacidiphila epipremni]NJP48255.1 hypothetical protein [Actinacidiphila epipremni]
MSMRAGDAALSGPEPPQRLVAGAGRPSVPLPRRFAVSRLDVADGLVRLTARDSRVITATPGQLTVWSQLLQEPANPDYEAQFEAEFLDRPARPADDTTDPELLLPAVDAVFGPIVPHAPSAFGTTAEIADIRPAVSAVPCVPCEVTLEFDSMSRRRILELLPAVHALLADLPLLWDRALTYLWEQGTDDDRAATGPADFRAAFRLMGVVVYHSGDFGLDLDDAGKEFVEDGYWARINFRADGSPAELVMMA